ncbi:MAG TPA: ATP synthase F0 subunit B [Polyangia bacterium]|nr:ATP synthase F0 subunit B [Polyangia bacterium]
MHTHLATFVFQLVNFLVLAGVLRYWLYRPVQALIARRQQEVTAPLAAAAADRAQAAQSRADVERQRAALAADRGRLLLEAGQQAAARREQVLADARRAAEDLVKEGREALARETAAAESQLRARAAELAVAIAARLLAGSGAADVTEHLLNDAVRVIEAMDGAAHDALAGAPGAAAGVRVVTAVPVAPVRRDAVVSRLHQALGDAVGVTFAEDPTLLAGAEIHLPTAVVRQTWRDQLALLRRELAGA